MLAEMVQKVVFANKNTKNVSCEKNKLILDFIKKI